VQEIQKYAPAPGVPTSVEGWAAIQQLVARGLCGEKDGLVFLAGQEEGCEQRALRYPHAMRKHRRVQWWVRALRWAPGVEGIAVGNSLAYHFTAEKSDSDLFIATYAGQTWLARLCTTLPLIVLRQRPGQRARHPVDCSFYAAPPHRTLASVGLPQDPYLEHWLLSLSPVVDGPWWPEMWTQNEAWAQCYPWALPARRAYAFRVAPRHHHLRFPVIFERLAGVVQRWQFPASITLFMNKDTRVRVENDLLKFHTNDRRAEYATKYEQLCRTHGIEPYLS
jgi:hypothetical protein